MTTDGKNPGEMVVPALPYGARFVLARDGNWDIRTDTHFWNGIWGTRGRTSDIHGVFTSIWTAAAEVPRLTPPPGWVEPKPAPAPPVVITHGMRHKERSAGGYSYVGSREGLEELGKQLGISDSYIIEPITCGCGGRGRKP